MKVSKERPRMKNKKKCSRKESSGKIYLKGILKFRRKKSSKKRKKFSQPFHNAWRVLSSSPAGGSREETSSCENVSGNIKGQKKSLNPSQILDNRNSLHKRIEKGMIILGYVKDVTNFEVIVMLPGRIKGCVPVTKISDEYSSLLQRFLDGEISDIDDLKTLFQPNQLVLAKVEEISESKGVQQAMLSLNPKDVNSIYSYESLQMYLILQASVKSVQELGYEMNCGLCGVQAFLKREETLFNSDFVVGQIVMCSIIGCLCYEDNVFSTAKLQLRTLNVAFPNSWDIRNAKVSEMAIVQKQCNFDLGPKKQEVFIINKNQRICKIYQTENLSDVPSIGKFCIVDIQKVVSKGLIVQDSVSGIVGTIPLEQLTDWPKISELVKNTYRRGDSCEAFCLHSSFPFLFTISSTFKNYFQNFDKEKRGSILQKNVIVPSRIFQIKPRFTIVNVPVPGTLAGELHSIKHGENAGWVMDRNKLNWTVEVQVRECVSYSSECSDLQGECCPTQEVDDHVNIENGVRLLEDYCRNLERIHSYVKEQGHPLGSLQFGCQVEGTIEKVLKSGAKLVLSNGAKAFVTSFHYEGMVLKKKTRVKGTVIFVDFLRKYAEISLRPDVCKLLLTLSLRCPEAYKIGNCQIIISKSAFSLGLYTFDNDNCCPVYIPSRWHINNFNPSPFSELGAFEEVVIVPNTIGVTIAIPKQVAERDVNFAKILENQICEKSVVHNSLKDIAVQEGLLESTQGTDLDGKEIIKDSDCKINEPVKQGRKSNNSSYPVNDTQETCPSLEKKKKSKGDDNNYEDTNIENRQSSCTNLDNLGINITVTSQPCAKRKNEQENKNFCCGELEGTTHTEHQLSVNKKKKSDTNSPMKEEDTIINELSDAPQNFLKVEAGFFWDAKLEALPTVLKQKGEESTSEEEEVHDESKKTKKKKKKLSVTEERELARREEEQIRKTEERLMNAERNPQSADDFDRLVMTSPNNSQNWIKYMAYYLQATEVVKARAVAERALKAISFREEQEKLNIWLALLNLENLFGTHESLQKTLEEAVKSNDPYKVRMQVLTMFSSTKKIEELDRLVQLVTKKYKHEKNTWIEAGTAYLKCGELEKSRQLMQKALNVLGKKYHVDVLSRFAYLENEMGDAQRAETIMENILSSYPKRIDVWMVYIDMLVKSKKLDLARQVLDRAIIQKLPPSKMKSLFKKFMKFEQDYGTQVGVQRVREMAKSYVETSS